MTLETREARMNSELVLDGRVHKSADYSMTIRDLVVHGDTTTAAITITLPSVAEAKGKTFRIYDHGGNAGSNNITVEDKSNDAGLTDITIATNNGYVEVRSDGKRWTTISSDLS